LLAAAQKEGKVAVIGPTGTDANDVLTKPFEQKYGIKVEFFGASNRDLVPRLNTERSASQFLWDVRVGGAILDELPRMGALDPIEPVLQPDISNAQLWRNGGIEFADKAHLDLVMSPFHRGTLFVNPNNVKPAEFKSYRDLLDPKWKGKIVMDDPRNSGPGQATFTFMYLHPGLGPEFIRDFARQQPLVLKDFPQEIDNVAQGKASVLVGTADFIAEARKKQGVPVETIDPTQLKEDSDVSPANGELALFNKAPHPNAAKLYINWLLSQEGQTAFVTTLGYVSNRLDVPTSHLPAWRVPRPNAIKTYTEDQSAVKTEKVIPLMKELFGS
jgi:iron(III) transport system substrate-binding protein